MNYCPVSFLSSFFFLTWILSVVIQPFLFICCSSILFLNHKFLLWIKWKRIKCIIFMLMFLTTVCNLSILYEVLICLLALSFAKGQRVCDFFQLFSYPSVEYWCIHALCFAKGMVRAFVISFLDYVPCVMTNVKYMLIALIFSEIIDMVNKCFLATLLLLLYMFDIFDFWG